MLTSGDSRLRGWTPRLRETVRDWKLSGSLDILEKRSRCLRRYRLKLKPSSRGSVTRSTSFEPCRAMRPKCSSPASAIAPPAPVADDKLKAPAISNFHGHDGDVNRAR